MNPKRPRSSGVRGKGQGVGGSSSTRVTDVQSLLQGLKELFDDSSCDTLYVIHVTNHYY